jgi:hypothetical protein
MGGENFLPSEKVLQKNKEKVEAIANRLKSSLPVFLSITEVDG